MRRFEDPSGKPWDVLVGRESWGAFYAIFVPIGAGRRDAVRQMQLRAGSVEAAELELDAMDEGALQALFEQSSPKES